ncbi:MAG: tetraacyldisaccharide 4'-kinase [Armatimonadetes bacterium]|nr:tetraacyldisaccharide 4'-kinase [Armatimonadota bacterium]
MMRFLEELWLEAASGGGGLVGKVACSPLRVVSWLYGPVALGYRRLYELGFRYTYTPPVPLLSVGALSVGGAGKTTVAGYLARRAAERNRLTAIVLRGYKRRAADGVTTVSDGRDLIARAEEAGDEALLLASYYSGVIVVVGKRREAALARAVELGAQVALLDDGFQYFRLRRDLDIVLLNALHWGPAMRVFPAGILREPPCVLSRASQIWLTHAGAVSEEELSALLRWVGRFAPHAPQVLTDHRTVACRLLSGEQIALEGARVAAFCGIGSPESFRRSLRAENPESVLLLTFPDHHWYSQEDISGVAAWASKAGAEVVVTTAKDAVRLDAAAWPESAPPIAVLEVGLEILQGSEFVEEALTQWLA